MDDDKKLQLILYIMAAISIAVIIGIWEMVIQPILSFVTTNVSLIQ